MRKSAVAGIGRLGCAALLDRTPTDIMKEAFALALLDSGLAMDDIDALIICPASIGEPRFMPAHYLASKLNLEQSLRYCGSTSTGGAGPISALLLADTLIAAQRATAVAIVAADPLVSLPPADMLERIRTVDKMINLDDFADNSKPIVPRLYDAIAAWHMNAYGTTREQLAMVPVLMSRQGIRHPQAMNHKEFTLDEVVNSKRVSDISTMLECARPADGGGAIIVTDAERVKDVKQKPVYILGGGEAAGLEFMPKTISEEMFPARRAVQLAFREAGLTVSNIRSFGIYDCFPICFLKCIEEIGLVGTGAGGTWIEERYQHYSAQDPRDEFPINTHGGLLSFGAPWEAAAIFSILEAVEQIRGIAENRQLQNPSPALVYGNGGVFTSAAVAILAS